MASTNAGPIIGSTGRCPTDTCKTSPHGGYGYFRADQIDGKSGKAGVYHWAWDLAGPVGTPVYAPENGFVVDVATGSSSPFTGYNPGVVMIRGNSGLWHLLGHLQYGTIGVRPGQFVTIGQKLGVMGISHTHWEVRRSHLPDYGCCPNVWQAHGQNNLDPKIWLAEVNRPVPTAVIAIAVALGGLGLSFGLTRVLLRRRAVV